MTMAVRHGLLRSALMCILPAALLTGVIAQLCTYWLGLDAVSPAKSLCVCVAGAALVLAGLRTGHPFESFGSANRVTVVRGALVGLLAGLIAERADTGAPALAFGVAVVAAVLDGVDGRVARQTRMVSSFGARFDMETDALLILVLAILAWQYGKAGAWVLSCGLLRYVFVAAGVLMPWLRHPLPPSYRRKVIAVVQVVALIVAVAPFVPVAASTAVAAIGLSALTLSFVVDVQWLFQYAAQARSGVPAP